ncbi:MAG TPA: PAS domain-containing protein [Chitinophagaceae bacterium]|nr:PAS domain-containing protein [Chitinophagaceae bacterium]
MPYLYTFNISSEEPMHAQAAISNQPFPGSKSELLNAMLAAFSESVFLFDTLQNRIVFISPQIITALGYPHDTDLINSRQISDLLHPEEKELVRQMSVEVLKRRIPVGVISIRVRHYGGEYRWFSLRQVIFDHSSIRPGYLFCVLVDIHARKEADIRIRRQNEAIQQYTFTASHVIRAPLANILGIISLIDSLPDDAAEERNRLLKMLQDSAAALDTTITDLIQHISGSKA